MEEALRRLQTTIAEGRLKDRNKMERRLGKIQARHPSVNDLYDISLRDTAEGVRFVLADERRPQELARVARRRLPAAHQSAGGHGRRALVEVHAVDRG